MLGLKTCLITINIAWNYLEGCNDSSDLCKTWIKEDWFPEWCKGKHKSNTAKGYFGGMTLMDTCKSSCGGCNGRKDKLIRYTKKENILNHLEYFKFRSFK